MNDIITEDFKEALITAVEARTSAHVVITQVLKNNGVKHTALTVRNTDAGPHTAPTFYLESIRPEYRTAENIDTIADEIVKTIESSQKGICGDDGTADTVERLQQIINSPEELKTRIFPRVINFDWNTELLEGLVHRPFLDLAITYDVEVADGAVLRLKNEMLEMSSLAEADLYRAAMQNAHIRSYMVTPIGELINRELGRVGFRPANPVTDVAGVTHGQDEINDTPMVVITNPSGINGAYGMLDDALLESVATRFVTGGSIGADFMVLLSSINEIIAYPVTGSVTEAEVDNMRSLVKSVNETNLSREEWLSENVYIFERGRGLRIA